MASSHFTAEKEADYSALSLKDYGNGPLGCGGCILIELLPHGETINAARYVETLKKLRRALRDKRPGKNIIL
jgi:hypothetical protein